MGDTVTSVQLDSYLDYLKRQERSLATIKQYQRDIQSFLMYIKKHGFCKESVIQYKEKLRKEYLPASVNVKLAAINGFLNYSGATELKVKQLRIQKKTYCAKEKELSKNEYLCMVNTARSLGQEKLALLLQTICGTGIRVSELSFITAEAVCNGEALIHMKGKTRTVLIPGKLRKVLKRYMGSQKISSGAVFVTRTGRPLDRSNIWKMMKRLCGKAGAETKKVFPHNLRHLFARCFYAADKDIAKLADVLGHSSINTTRIYIKSSGVEHRQRMDALGLVI